MKKQLKEDSKAMTLPLPGKAKDLPPLKSNARKTPLQSSKGMNEVQAKPLFRRSSVKQRTQEKVNRIQQFEQGMSAEQLSNCHSQARIYIEGKNKKLDFKVQSQVVDALQRQCEELGSAGLLLEKANLDLKANIIAMRNSQDLLKREKIQQEQIIDMLQEKLRNRDEQIQQLKGKLNEQIRQIALLNCNLVRQQKLLDQKKNQLP